MKKRLYAALLALAMAASLLLPGCGSDRSDAAAPKRPGGEGGKGPVSASPPVTGQAPVRPSLLSALAPLYDTALRPAAGDAAGDPRDAINYDQLEYRLGGEAGELLRKNGFVVIRGYDEEFFDIYESNRYALVPSFVTTDAMMHTYHLYFSRLLKGMEKDCFLEDLSVLSAAMLEDSLAQLTALEGTQWAGAAERNAAFFAVARGLLEPGSTPPARVAGVVEQELALIDGAAGIQPSPVMGMEGASVMEDYSQYVPRGYYAGDEALSRYFKAMMWFGRLSFLAGDESLSRSAALMTLALTGNSAAMKAWERVYIITSFFAGASDDPGVYEYAAALEKAYGGLPEAAALPGMTAQWDAFARALKDMAPPAINSVPVFASDDLESAIEGFRFMGQRFSLDASIFQQLVYRQVGANRQGELRMLPSALDIPAALGSDLALQLLEQAGATGFDGYPEHMDALREYLSDAPDALWTTTLYGGWLNTLLPLTAPSREGYPQFMRSQAWDAKKLNTFLGSWTELKHDTILYVKQVYAEMGGGEEYEQRDDRGYVEPEPVLFGRLAALCKATADGLERYGVLRDSDRENLERMGQLSEKLMLIAQKELKNQLPSDEEFELIRTFGGQLEHFWYDALKNETGSEYISRQEYPAALVADVATDPNGTVLEVGSGYIDTIYVLVNVDGSPRIAQGGVFSFYEFPQPLSQRLTDQQWRQMLGIDPSFDANGDWVDGRADVPRPAWTSLFLAPARSW